MNIPIYDWGRDHWSTFGYIEIRIVDFKGIPDNHHMRCDPKLHPLLAHDSIAVKDYPDGVTDDRKCPHCNSITTVKWSV